MLHLREDLRLLCRRSPSLHLLFVAQCSVISFSMVLLLAGAAPSCAAVSVINIRMQETLFACPDRPVASHFLHVRTEKKALCLRLRQNKLGHKFLLYFRLFLGVFRDQQWQTRRHLLHFWELLPL